VPLGLLDLISLGGFTSPSGTQWRDLRANVVNRRVEARGCRVNVLAYREFDFREVIGQHWIHDFSSPCKRRDYRFVATAPIWAECVSPASRSTCSLARMVSEMPCSACCSFTDSVFHRSTTPLNAVAAFPPHTDCGTLVILPMNPCNNERISSFRRSILPATSRIRSKSVVRLPDEGEVMSVLSLSGLTCDWTAPAAQWFPVIRRYCGQTRSPARTPRGSRRESRAGS